MYTEQELAEMTAAQARGEELERQRRAAAAAAATASGDSAAMPPVEDAAA